MNIEELSNKIYEDLNGYITAVENSDELVIRFQCDNWDNYSERLKFIITCSDVIESNICPATSGEINFTGNHQTLWNHNMPQGYLYYSSEAENRHEILGRIWECHENLFRGWRPLADYANTNHAGQITQFCSGSHGLLAQGPKNVLKAYKDTIASKIETNYVASYTPSGGYKALIFDDCFVICKSVRVARCCS